MKATFPISKRVFLSVYEHPDVARAELRHWFSTVYHNPDGIDASGIHGTPEELRARIEGLVAGRTTCYSIPSAGTPSSWKRWRK
jgi:hypothetical protein